MVVEMGFSRSLAKFTASAAVVVFLFSCFSFTSTGTVFCFLSGWFLVSRLLFFFFGELL